jgi:hypothetical protein
MPDQPKPPEAWLPLTIDMGLGAAAAPAPAPAAAKEVVTTGKVGEEIQAYCPSPRCQKDAVHTIISTYEDEIRRVQCVMCGEVHAFRRPRGTAEQPDAEAEAMWEANTTGITEEEWAEASPYSIHDEYMAGDLITHPVHGAGVVGECLDDDKVSVVFRSGSRVLVHGR